MGPVRALRQRGVQREMGLNLGLKRGVCGRHGGGRRGEDGTRERPDLDVAVVAGNGELGAQHVEGQGSDARGLPVCEAATVHQMRGHRAASKPGRRGRERERRSGRCAVP